MIRYPHKLYIAKSCSGTKDSSGNWVASDAIWTYVGDCREEANGSGRKVSLADGSLFTYSSVIFIAPVSSTVADDILAATKVLVRESDDVTTRCEAAIIRFSNDRKGGRIWV